MPQIASKEASLRTAKSTDKFDNKTKFELIKEEHHAILEEKQAAKKAETQRIAKETLVDTAPVVHISSSDGENPRP